jgi:hypothetical protein
VRPYKEEHSTQRGRLACSSSNGASVFHAVLLVELLEEHVVPTFELFEGAWHIPNLLLWFGKVFKETEEKRKENEAVVSAC